jgi:RHS repeat-associated protein
MFTDHTGLYQTGQGYLGYGKYRTGGSLPTNYRYTGQELDIPTGLMYYGARYYDRTVGMFVSPDTLVPDPTHVYDYNRYMYAGGNPLKYNDPTGHCKSYKKLGEEPSPVGTDRDCWGLVDHILRLWDEDQTGYWDERYGSQDIFRKHVAAAAGNNSEFMETEILLYNTNPRVQELNEARRKAEAIERKARADDIVDYDYVCEIWDCTALGLDIAAIGGDIVREASPICAIASPACYTAGQSLSVGATAYGLARTESAHAKGDASDADLAVNRATAIMSLRGRAPIVTSVGGVIQLIWDILDPFHPW